jgi:hypothetical protein
VFNDGALKSSDEMVDDPFVTKKRSVVELALPDGSVEVMR